MPSRLVETPKGQGLDLHPSSPSRLFLAHFQLEVVHVQGALSVGIPCLITQSGLEGVLGE